LFHDVISVAEHVRAGRVTLIGTGGASSLAEFPAATPIANVLPGFAVHAWYAMVAPPKTPANVASRISQDVAEVLHMPEFAAKLRSMFITPLGLSPNETAAFFRQEAERYRQVIVSAGIKAK
jgi:tripartite-type tricarboxylate transporter receptor subunit TctC